MAAGTLAVLSLICSSPLLRDGWFKSHEELRPIARALAAWYEIADGDLYPRWLASGYLGKGMPLFDFYPPAFSLLVAYAHALGVPLLLAAKLVIYLLFFAGSFGVYLWARPHVGPPAGLVAAILYLFAPYHFVDLYVRGATAEFTSLAAFPYLFLAIDLLAARLSARGLAALALSSAAVVLSHFLGALMIAPFALVYALARARRSGGWRGLGRIAMGGLIGAGLSAFFWLPALAEKGALSAERLERSVTGYYSPFLHFVHPRQWLDSAWGFGGSVPMSYDDGMSFQIGLLILGAIGASLALSTLLERDARRFLVLSTALAGAALWLTSPGARLWYEWLSPFRLVQFPWRFLGPATVFLAAAGSGCANVLARRSRWGGHAAVALAATLAIGLSVGQRAVEAPLPVADDRDAIAALSADPWTSKFGNEDEFLPRDADPETAEIPLEGENPAGPGVEVGTVRRGRTDLTFEVTAATGNGVVWIPWYDFPGWRATLDGREWPLAGGARGFIALRVPEGRHVARVWFGTTPPRVLGWLLAGTAACALVVALLLERRLRASRAGAVP